MREDGERAQVGAVAVVGDHQIPGRVPARRRGRQQVAEPAEAARHAGRVEGAAHRPEAERQRPCPRPATQTSRREIHSARQLSRTAAIRAGSARSALRQAGAAARLAPARARRRTTRRSRGARAGWPSRRCRGSSARGSERRRRAPRCKWQEITTPSGNLGYEPTMSRQARQRRRRHNRAGPDPDPARRRRRARRRADRSARSRRSATCCTSPQSAPGARNAAPDRERRLLAGVRRRRHAPGLHPVRRAAHPDHLERDPDEPEERHGRDRGPALLQERRRRPDRDLPLGRQGRHPRRSRCRAARRSRCS